MEDWQKVVIKKNLADLLKVTVCNKILIAKLLGQNIINEEEEQQIDAMKTPISQADKLYKLLVTRRNAYQVLLQACKEENQSNAVFILENGQIEHRLSQALHECNVAKFICRCFISISDFESIQQAIARYTKLMHFKAAFDQDVGNKPWLLRGPQNETLLHVATAYGYIKLMKYFIKLGVSVNELDTVGRNSGHYLGKVSTNVIETTKVLIDNGLNINHADINGMTAASTLAIYNNITQYHYYHWVDHVINNGCGNVFTKICNTGATPLFHAIETMDIETDTLELVCNSGNHSINLADEDGRTVLHIALMSGRRLKIIQRLIGLGADYKMKDKTGGNVLHFAVQGSNREVILFLLSLYSDINEVDKINETPMHKIRLSKSRQYFGLTKLLLDIGADLDVKNKKGETLAHLLASDENVSADDFQIWVKGVINDGYTHIFSISGPFGNPLQTAIMRLDLDLETIKLLLESSMVDINEQNSEGSTLLQLASEHGRTKETIESLVQLGANIQITDNEGSGVLHLAVIGGNKEAISFLVSQGLDINKTNEYGDTPMHFVEKTRRKNHYEMLKTLLDNGADSDCMNKKGSTLTHATSLWEHATCDDLKTWVSSMIDDGHVTWFTTTGEWNRTPLYHYITCMDVDLETLKLIIDSTKHDINRPDIYGTTILHLALDFGRSLDTIKNLLYLGADWRLNGFNGRTVIHYAVSGSNHEGFLYFKSLGADVNATDRSGETALIYCHYPRKKDYLGMTKLLLDNGANINVKDQYGQTLEKMMASKISRKSYQDWKEGMILLGYSSLFQENSKIKDYKIKEKKSILAKIFSFGRSK